MCGIAGTFGKNAHAASQRSVAVLQSIKHRGPDAEGSYLSSDQQFFVAHTRLAIIDPSQGGAQPMQSAAAVLAFNGELYNHAQIRKARLKSSRFESDSDTETLLRGLDVHGMKILSDLEGMYAAAYFNKVDKTLWLFRDPMAIKPLYYTVSHQQSICFASEIKALWTLDPTLERRVDPLSLNTYLHFENLAVDKTLFHNVHALKPGEILRVTYQDDTLRLESSQIVSPGTDETVSYASDDELIASVHHVIEDSVDKHLLSDRPIGVYLSGGIDSSLVATLAARRQTNLMGFTGFFPDEASPYYDERPLARLVAQKAGIETLHEVAIRPADFAEHFDSLIHTLDEPRMGMGSFSQFMVAKVASAHRPVVLAGHGGDELFAGYPLHRAFCLLDEMMPRSDRLPILRKAHSKEWAWIAYTFLSRYWKGHLQFAPEIFSLKQYPKFDDLPFLSRCVRHPLSQLDSYYREVYLPGLLAVEDKISMHFGMETRVPLWSQKIYRFVSRIPIARKLRGGQLKGLLKEVAKEILPREILAAPKRGFPTPIRNWLRGPLREFTRQRLLTSSDLHQIVPVRTIKVLLSSHQRKPLPFALDERRAHKIWMLLCLESWTRQYRVSLETAANTWASA
ncbi:MAG: asparagine synthase (glutamine-hydrolyzing) [Myxococcota bacterium]